MILQSFKKKDQNEEQQEFIELWLLQVDRAKEQLLPKNIFDGIRSFFFWKLKYCTRPITDCLFFYQLKPRLQNELLKLAFSPYYNIFKEIFEGCDSKFKNQVFLNSEFRYYSKEGYENEEDEKELTFIKFDEVPVLQEAGKQADFVYMIITG